MTLRLNLRSKFLWTFTSLTTATVITLVAVPTWIASRAVERQYDESLSESANRTAQELGVWVTDREREVSLFSQIEVFRAACQGVHGH